MRDVTVLLRVLVVLLVAQTPGAWAHDAHDVYAKVTGVDLRRLPLGDTRVTSAPKVGGFWSCRNFLDNGDGPPAVTGPWIGKDTYDLLAKPMVRGAVRWPHQFTMTVTEDARVFTSNDLPDHPTGVFPIAPDDPAHRYDRNPNRIAAQNMRIVLPLNPVQLPRPTCAGGAVGILLSGVALFSALDAVGLDAVAHETQDACQGHPQITGTYHYHSVTPCIEDEKDAKGHSQLVGYALDGFGIYGHSGDGGKTLTSADLDECHGHTHAIVWNDKTVNMYHYHATWDFPYTLGCFRGRMDMQAMRVVSGGPLPQEGRGGERGPDQDMSPDARRPTLAQAAAKLGIPVEKLHEALGPPPPDFTAAAARLGVSVEALRNALGRPGGPPRNGPPRNGPPPNRPLPGGPPQGGPR